MTECWRTSDNQLCWTVIFSYIVRAVKADGSKVKSFRSAALAQSVERLTRNEKVVGSIPTGGSTSSPWYVNEKLKSGGSVLGLCIPYAYQ